MSTRPLEPEEPAEEGDLSNLIKSEMTEMVMQPANAQKSKEMPLTKITENPNPNSNFEPRNTDPTEEDTEEADSLGKHESQQKLKEYSLRNNPAHKHHPHPQQPQATKHSLPPNISEPSDPTQVAAPAVRVGRTTDNYPAALDAHQLHQYQLALNQQQQEQRIGVIGAGGGIRITKKQMAFPLKVQSINAQVDPSAGRKKKHVRHLKNRHGKSNLKPRRNSAQNVPLQETKILDGFLLLHSCRVKYPYEAIKSKLTNEGIYDVEEGDLLFFQNLISIDLSENRIKLEQLLNFKALQELNLMYNNISNLTLQSNSFPNLEVLNLAFNNIPPTQIPILGQLQNLK